MGASTLARRLWTSSAISMRLMILKGIGVVLKVRQNDVRPVGFFQGEDISPRALASADVKALEARFRDVEFGGVRHQVLPLR